VRRRASTKRHSLPISWEETALWKIMARDLCRGKPTAAMASRNESLRDQSVWSHDREKDPRASMVGNVSLPEPKSPGTERTLRRVEEIQKDEVEFYFDAETEKATQLRKGTQGTRVAR